MAKKKKLNNGNINEEIKISRKERAFQLSELSNYNTGYNVDTFIRDLVAYFDNEVDFDLEKIRKIVEADNKIDHLISESRKNNTHPVIEFVQEIFKDITR